MKNKITFCLAFLLALSIGGCAGKSVNKELLQPCQCGTQESDILGCTSACSLGEVCESPLCTCEHQGVSPKSDPKEGK